jgi:general secretion pathway protein J
MNRLAMNRRQAGFTLLETLIALVVLGMLVVGLAQGLRFGMVAWNHQAQTTQRYADLDAVDRALRRVVGQMDPGNAHDAPTVQGTAASITFTSELPDNAADLPTRRAEMRLLVDGAHRLVLRWAPYTHAQRLGPPPQPRDVVLVGQVARLELAYWPRPRAPGGAAPGWRTSWTAPDLPGLVRIRLVFEAGSAMQWPDIVIAPQLGRL